MTRLASASDRLIGWVQDKALPMWGRRCRDHRGGFYEALMPDGAPCTAMVKRTRVQPRQAYVYAHADVLGWTDQGRSASDHAFSFLLNACTDDDSLMGEEAFTGFVHRVTPEGRPHDARRDTYDHAFVLLACAWRIIAFRDEQARSVADRTLAFLGTLRQDDGSFLEGRPAALPRRQNPHMHLFEAFLALDLAGIDSGLPAARSLRRLFGETFWDGRVLREFFGQDWSLDPARADCVEPGHMAEWVSLLDAYDTATGEDQSGPMASLFGAAQAFGADPGGSPFLIDTASADGTPSRTTRRAWVQCEYARAALVLARRGDDEAARTAAEVIDAMLGTYLSAPIEGGWNDQYDERGEVVSPDMPTSTFYHILGLAAEAQRTMKALG